VTTRHPTRAAEPQERDFVEYMRYRKRLTHLTNRQFPFASMSVGYQLTRRPRCVRCDISPSSAIAFSAELILAPRVISQPSAGAADSLKVADERQNRSTSSITGLTRSATSAGISSPLSQRSLAGM
jgi:hypothetical protein